MARPRIPLLQRLSKFLGVMALDDLDPEACWTWGGYVEDWKPKVVLNGKRVGARRAIYEELFGKLEDGKHVKPLCGTPLCVNPHHAGVVGDCQPAAERNVPVEAFEPPPDEPLDAEFVADLIMEMPTRDAREIARQLRVPIEVVKEALTLV